MYCTNKEKEEDWEREQLMRPMETEIVVVTLVHLACLTNYQKIVAAAKRPFQSRWLLTTMHCLTQKRRVATGATRKRLLGTVSYLLGRQKDEACGTRDISENALSRRDVEENTERLWIIVSIR